MTRALLQQARDALAELVAVKDIHDRQERCWPGDPEAPALARAYSQRKEPAWAVVRSTLAALDEALAAEAPAPESKSPARATPPPAPPEAESVEAGPIFRLTSIVHKEAGRTLSRDDFDLCMRIARRAASAAQAVPEGWRLLKNSTQEERSWPEDPRRDYRYSHCCETCGRTFLGSKLQVICRVCAASPAPEICQHPRDRIKTGCDAKYSIAWCGDCGQITHCDDGIRQEDLSRQDRERWCRENVLAYGCASEARGDKLCSYWCGHPEQCSVSLRAAPPAPRSKPT